MTRSVRAFALASLGTLAYGSVVSAQTARPAPRRVEVAAGVLWLGSSALGTKDAMLTTATGGVSRLFTTSSTLGITPGLDVRITVQAWRRLDVEAFGAFAKPSFSVAVTNDVENAASTTASDPVKEYVVGGGAVWNLPYKIGSTRLLPFVSGGAAYLRELHDSNTLAVTGRLYEGGGGVKYVTRPRAKGTIKSLGIRAEARLQARMRGVAVDDSPHYRGAVMASAFLRF